MNTPRRTLRTVVTVLIALAVNLILDVGFELPMLIRWVIALGVVLAVVATMEVIQRRTAPRHRAVSRRSLLDVSAAGPSDDPDDKQRRQNRDI